MKALQYVDSNSTKIGQTVFFKGKKAAWKVISRDGLYTQLQRGNQTCRVSSGWKLLQEPFANL